jgi:hypothetical protein
MTDGNTADGSLEFGGVAFNGGRVMIPISDEEALKACRSAIEQLADAPGGIAASAPINAAIEAAATIAGKLDVAHRGVTTLARWRAESDVAGAQELRGLAAEACIGLDMHEDLTHYRMGVLLQDAFDACGLPERDWYDDEDEARYTADTSPDPTA